MVWTLQIPLPSATIAGEGLKRDGLKVGGIAAAGGQIEPMAKSKE
jgi:hypothetical protein